MEIRQALGDDEIAIARGLFREYEAELGMDLCFQGFERELAGLPGDYAPPSGRLLLAWMNGQPVGCVALRRIEEGVCEMKRLYLKPSMRRGGAGRLITLTLIQEARTLGYRRLRLDTLPVMKAAIALYRSLGFQSIPPYRHNPIEGVLYLELDLGTAELPTSATKVP
ncbi:MAG: GNAT family N-acetyltransferase [Acidobacteria bacterium]|nr:GNAT family N-acetyltransferase [Acidobacteriota bacterium]MCI0567355.1 GNAT family N-acetyltransferase [Acidobacteriota bacterium]